MINEFLFVNQTMNKNLNCWKWIWSFFLMKFCFEKKMIDIVILIYSIYCDRIFQWFRLMQIEQKYQKIERKTIVDKYKKYFRKYWCWKLNVWNEN